MIGSMVKGRTLGILFNPISGSGKGRALAEHLRHDAGEHGYDARVIESQPRYEKGALESITNGLEALVVVGGDGTLMPLLDGLSASRTPVIMYPAGNQSLFARTFHASSDRHILFETLKRFSVCEARYATANGQPFFSMVSIGLDAEVVAAIARTRRSHIGRRGYVLPTMRAFASHKPATLSVSADGVDVISKQRGYFIAANSAEYACGLNPVAEARIDSPLLHARFYPYRHRWSYLAWLVSLILRRPVPAGRSVSLQANEFYVSGDVAAVQMDGEWAGSTPVRIRREDGFIRVLV